MQTTIFTMKKNIQLILLFTLVPVLIYAHQGSIKGLIIDQSTKEPLIGATITVKNSNIGTTTDIEGKYELKISEGTHIVSYGYLGYKNQEKTIKISSAATIEINIGLIEESTILSTTVVSGSRFEKKLGEETISLDVIKTEFIDNQNLVTAEDAVKRSSGVTVIDKQVNIRGGSGYSYGAGSRVMILLDDLPILQADAGGANWSSIPMESIGQIEIIKGAASALYGSSAMNGIINIRTAYPTNEPITKISTFGTVYANPRKEYDEDGNLLRKDWWNNDITYLTPGDENSGLNTKKPRPYNSGINISHRQKFGKFDLVAGAQVLSGQEWKYGAFEHRGRFSAQTRYRINENLHIGLNGNIQGGKNGTFFLWNGHEGVNKYLPAALVGEPTEVKTFRATIDPFLNYSDDKGNRHKVLGRWYKVDNNSTNDQSNFSNFFYGEYQYQKSFKDINLVLSGGLVANYVKVTAPLYGDTTLSGRNLALYLQADKKFFNKLNISLGARIESNKQTDSKTETNPVFRLGANYQAAEYTYFRASFGQGYRFPTIAEKFISTSLGTSVAIAPNPLLTSETGISAELGIKQGLKVGKFSAFIDIAGFFNRYHNMMEFNPTVDPSVLPSGGTFGFQSQNVGNTQIWGIETSLQGEGKIFGKFPSTAMLGYTYISPKYSDWDKVNDESETDYNVLKYRFRHTFTGSWDINFNGFDFGVSARYFSFMENIDVLFTSFIPGLTDYRNSRLKDNWEDLNPKRQHKGDFILDLRTGYTFKKDKNKYKLSAILNNVSNKEYSLRPGLIEAPLSYTLRLDVEF